MAQNPPNESQLSFQQKIKQQSNNYEPLLIFLFHPKEECLQSLEELANMPDAIIQKLNQLSYTCLQQLAEMIVERFDNPQYWTDRYELLFAKAIKKLSKIDKTDFEELVNNQFIPNMLNVFALYDIIDIYIAAKQKSLNLRSSDLKLKYFEDEIQFYSLNMEVFEPEYNQYETIYWKRYERLNPQQKMEYELLTLAGLYRFESSLDSDMLQSHLAPFYLKLPAIEQPWLLNHLINFPTKQSKDLIQQILSLKLIKLQDQSIVLHIEEGKLNSKLVNMEIIAKCIKNSPTNPQKLFFFCQDFFLIDGDKLYMKFSIEKMQKINENFLNLKLNRNRQQMIEQSTIQFTNVMKIFDHLIHKRKIFVFQGFMDYLEISEGSTLELLSKLLTCLKLIIKNSSKRAIQPYLQSWILAPENLTILSYIISFVEACPFSRAKDITDDVLNILRYIVNNNETSLTTLVQSTFIAQFVKYVHRYTKESEYIIDELPKFLNQYISKMFALGFDVQSLPMEDLYALKWKTVWQYTQDPYEGLFDDSPFDEKINLEKGTNQTQVQEIKRFLENFPGAVPYFERKLKDIDNIKKYFDPFCIIRNSSYNDYLITALAIYQTNGIASDENFNKQMRQLFKNYSHTLSPHQKSIPKYLLTDKIGLNIQSQIIENEQMLLNLLKTNKIVDKIEISELCELSLNKINPNNELINLLKMINYLMWLLTIDKERLVTRESIRRKLEIYLHLEMMESTSLHRIVEYQSKYSQNQINKYKCIGIRFLYSQIKLNITYFNDGLQKWIGKLALPQINEFLYNFDIILDSIDNCPDRNHILKTLKMITRFFDPISKQIGNINIFFQLFNFHKVKLIRILSSLWKEYKTESPITGAVTMGISYVQHVHTCNKNKVDPIAQFEEMHHNHIRKELINWNSHIFNHKLISYKSILINNQKYKGDQLVNRVKVSVGCKFLQILTDNIEQSIDYCLNMTDTIFDNLLEYSESANDEQKPIPIVEHQIQMHSQTLLIIPKQEHLSVINLRKTALLQKLFDLRANQPQKQSITELFLTVLSYVNYEECKSSKFEWIETIFTQITEVMAQESFDDNKFETLTRWMDQLLTSIQNINQLPNFSSAFVKKYLQIIMFLLNKPREQKTIFSNTLKIVQKLLPSSMDNNSKDTKMYIHTILKIAVKIISDINESVELPKILHKIISLNDPQFFPYFGQIFKVISIYSHYISVLDRILKQQSPLLSMEADIHGYFFKQNQKNEGTQTSIKTQLDKFINVFSQKYKNDVQNFSKMSCKLVRATIQEKRTTKIVYLLYDKPNKFDHSEILDTEYINWKPSFLFRQAIKYMLASNTPTQLNNKLQCLQAIIYHHPYTLPFLTFYPVTIEGKTISLIDYLVEQTFTSPISAVYDFLLFVCFDHSCIVQCSTKPIIFSQYVAYRIINQLLLRDLNSNSLLFLFYMTQLKRFNFFCQVKLNEQKGSIADKLTQLLKSSRTGFHRTNTDNILILKILSLIYYQQIQKIKDNDSVSKDKQPKLDRYKLIQQSLIPHYSENSLVNLHYQQSFKEATLDQLYSSLDKIEQRIFEKSNQEEQTIQERILPNIDDIDIEEALSKFNNQDIKWKTILNEEVHSANSTILNLSHHRQTEKLYHIINLDPSGKKNDLFIQRIKKAMQIKSTEQIAKENSLNGQKCEQMKKIIEPKLIYLQSNKIQKLLSNDRSQSNHPQREVELEKLIKIINSMQLLLNQEFVSLEQFKDQPYEESKHYLQRKMLETEFDFNERSMTLEEFQSYLCSKSHQLDFLTEERKRKKQFAESKMFAINMQRTLSSTSTNYLIDVMDQNLINLQIIRDKFSQQRAFSQDVQIQNGQVYHFDKNIIANEPFSKIREDLLFEIVLSLYYESEAVYFNFMKPFIQNKQTQEKFINTLVYILRNPFQNQYFPKQIYSFSEQDKKWVLQTKNLKQKSTKIIVIERIIQVILMIGNRQFLKQPAGYECLNQIKLQKCALSQGCSEDKYIPFYEILRILFECKSETLFDFFQQVETLPSSLLQKLLELLSIMDQQYQLHKFVLNYSESKKLQFKIQKQSELYGKIRALYSNQDFIRKFRQIYTGEKQPNPLFLAQLINTPIYTFEQMQVFHLYYLNIQQTTDDIFRFLNKVMAIYSDEALASALWLEEYKTVFSKLITFLNKKKIKIQEQPINRIFKFSHLMSYEMKLELLSAKLNENREGRYSNWDNQQRRLKIRKTKVFESTFEKLKDKHDNYWRSNFQIVFQDENGVELSGTGPGVNKQWYNLATKGMVNLDYGLFKKTSQNIYYFNRESHVNPRHLQYFEFIGKLFANSIIQPTHYIYPSFSRILYKRILSLPIEIEDIITEKFEEGNFYKEISIIKDIKSSQQFQDMGITGMTFTYTDKRLIADKNYQLVKNSHIGRLQIKGLKQKNKFFLKEEQLKVIDPNAKDTENMSLAEVPNININILNIGEIVELLPGGSTLEVTFENRLEYLKLLRQKIIEIIVKQTNQQYQQFLKGLNKIVDIKLLSRFTADELRDLIEGSSNISVSDLRQHIIINDYDKTDEIIVWFFEFLEELSAENFEYLIQFWTGQSKIGRGGFKDMRMTIKKTSKMFRVQTCHNLLALPKYQCKQQLRQILMTGIMSIKQNEANIEELW